MGKNLATAISIAFHPVFVNAFSLYVLLSYHPVLSLSLSATAFWFYMLFLFSATAVIPMVSVLLLRVFGRVKSIQLPNADDRRTPYIVTSIMYLTTYFLFQKIHVPSPVLLFVLLGAAIVVALMVINQFYKISIHMASWGMLTGVLIAFAPYNEMRILIALSILLSGLTASARLFALSHDNKQILAGFTLGLLFTIVLL